VKHHDDACRITKPVIRSLFTKCELSLYYTVYAITTDLRLVVTATAHRQHLYRMIVDDMLSKVSPTCIVAAPHYAAT